MRFFKHTVLLVALIGAPVLADERCPEGATLVRGEPDSKEERVLDVADASWCERSGVRHGDYVSWYRNGQICKIEPYRNGRRHGTVEKFFHSGTLRSETTFSDGEHRRYTIWRQDGTLAEKGRSVVIDGSRVVHYSTFSRDGVLAKKGERHENGWWKNTLLNPDGSVERVETRDDFICTELSEGVTKCVPR